MQVIKSQALRAKWSRLVRKAERSGEPDLLTPFPTPPLCVFCGGGKPRRLFFFTSDIYCRQWTFDDIFPSHWFALSRRLIPNDQYLEEVVACVARLRLPLVFVGALMPVDLTLFGMLRTALQSSRLTRNSRVVYGGIDDRWLALSDRHRRAGRSFESLLIPMEHVDREHLDFVREFVPDLEEIIGPRSMAVLNSGRKYTLESSGNQLDFGRHFAKVILKHLDKVAVAKQSRAGR